MKSPETILNTTRKYRKTAKGVLTNSYHKQRERCKNKHLPLPGYTLEEFHNRFLYDKKFIRLFNEWVKSGYNKQYKPSIDRIDCRKTYTMNNIQCMTWAENRFKQSAFDGKRGRKPAVLQMLGDKVIRKFYSQRHAVKELGLSQGDLSMVLNGKRNTVNGYKFIYTTPELLKEDNNA